MNEPQPCTKCKKLPEDILMLSCGHDLCLDCASQRLVFQMKKKKTANSIVCQICFDRTQLDIESIAQLQKLIPTSKLTAGKTYAEPRQPYQRVERIVPRINQSQFQQKTAQKVYERQPIRDYSYASQANIPASNNVLASGISSRKQCSDHPDEQILYFCFDCKIECICPQCIIHGRHKDHDVKTIKKSAPVIKAELEKNLDKIQSSIENLLIKKSQVDKNIRVLNEQNTLSKRQVQSAFEQVRNKLALKQKQILSSFDTSLNSSLDDLQKTIKDILKRIEDLRSYSSVTNEFMKKQDLILLNFYAKRWKQISQDSKQVSVNITPVASVNNEKLLSSILELTDYSDRLALFTNKKGG